VTTTLRRSVLAVAATTCAVLTVGSLATGAWGSPQTSAASQTVVRGKTTVDLNGKTVKALHSAGFSVSATGPADLKGATLSLPVSGGTYNQGVGTIVHTGGIKISKGAKSVTIKDLIIHLKSGAASADVSSHGRISAVDVGSPQNGSGGPHWVSYGGFSVALSKATIKVLDHAFSTMAFANHDKLGVGSTTLHFEK
jgi:hypothetical protein